MSNFNGYRANRLLPPAGNFYPTGLIDPYPGEAGDTRGFIPPPKDWHPPMADWRPPNSWPPGWHPPMALPDPRPYGNSKFKFMPKIMRIGPQPVNTSSTPTIHQSPGTPGYTQPLPPINGHWVYDPRWHPPMIGPPIRLWVPDVPGPNPFQPPPAGMPPAGMPPAGMPPAGLGNRRPGRLSLGFLRRVGLEAETTIDKPVDVNGVQQTVPVNNKTGNQFNWIGDDFWYMPGGIPNGTPPGLSQPGGMNIPPGRQPPRRPPYGFYVPAGSNFTGYKANQVVYYASPIIGPGGSPEIGPVAP